MQWFGRRGSISVKTKNTHASTESVHATRLQSKPYVILVKPEIGKSSLRLIIRTTLIYRVLDLDLKIRLKVDFVVFFLCSRRTSRTPSWICDADNHTFFTRRLCTRHMCVPCIICAYNSDSYIIGKTVFSRPEPSRAFTRALLFVLYGIYSVTARQTVYAVL